MMGKNRERVRFCFIAAPDAAKTNLGRTRGGKNQGVPQFIAVERITPRAAWRSTISESVTSRAAWRSTISESVTSHAAWRSTISESVTSRAAWRSTISESVTPRRGFQARYGFQARLLRGEISLRSDHCIPACPAGPAISASSPRPRCLQDYYALKSHCVPTIASRLALPNPQSRHLHRDLGVFKIITR